MTSVRSPHFQEKVETTMAASTGAGIHPVFAPSADVDTTMVATRDIGAVVADALTNPAGAAGSSGASEIVHLDGPRYTEREVARRLGLRLGRELEVVVLPRKTWEPTFVDAGLPPLLAAELAALHEAEARGLLEPAGDRRHVCTTDLDETLAEITAALV
ncbi:hypothetical protein [Saccharomonospora sp. CUA-673]|uniref:hypothetical protein n=1 Tax=Saccharomonospora sp. CUA-673 TaxID=1904969 RepID=UPI001115126E|nr:hypothetical protein [Saccharomonospora sp. CUA-673]